MSEPLTDGGRRLHDALCAFATPHGCHHGEAILAIEAEAREQGAKAERERLRAVIVPGTYAPGGVAICACRIPFRGGCWHCVVRAALDPEPAP